MHYLPTINYMSLDISLSKKPLQSYFMICMYTVVVKMLLFYVFIFNVVCVQFATILRLYELGMVTFVSNIRLIGARVRD